MITYKDIPTSVYPLLIAGKQGSGKSTTKDLVAEKLAAEGFVVQPYKFAGTLYEMHDACLAIMQRQGIEVPEKDGRLLQLLGSEWAREVFGKDVWVKCALADYQAVVDHNPVKGPFQQNIVFLIDDLRFQNELEAFSFGLKIRLECDRELRKARCPAWRDVDDHVSEVDLDGSLGLFNEVISTEYVHVEGVASLIVQAFKDKFGPF